MSVRMLADRTTPWAWSLNSCVAAATSSADDEFSWLIAAMDSTASLTRSALALIELAAELVVWAIEAIVSEAETTFEDEASMASTAEVIRETAALEAPTAWAISSSAAADRSASADPVSTS